MGLVDESRYFKFSDHGIPMIFFHACMNKPLENRLRCILLGYYDSLDET